MVEEKKIRRLIPRDELVRFLLHEAGDAYKTACDRYRNGAGDARLRENASAGDCLYALAKGLQDGTVLP